MRNSVTNAVFALAVVALLASSGRGQVILRHAGPVDPQTEGWTPHGPGVGCVTGPYPGQGGWKVHDTVAGANSTFYYERVASASQLAAIQSDGWVLSVVMWAALPGTVVCANASRCVSLYDGNAEYTLAFAHNGSTDAICRLQDSVTTCNQPGPRIPGGAWTIAPYSTIAYPSYPGSVVTRLDLVKPPSTSSASLYVNFQTSPSLSGYTGHSLGLPHAGPGVLFGSISNATDGGAVYGVVELRPFRNRIFVRSLATGADNGTDWTNAYTNLQDALTEAKDIAYGDVEIWVAEGSYFADRGVGYTPNNRLHSFSLRDRISILGGFAGRGPDPSRRDWEEYPTILDGDIGQVGTNVDNTLHVVRGSGTGSSAVLDGFIIQSGNANSSTLEPVGAYGGGVWLNEGGPTIQNCLIRWNHASYGAGLCYYADQFSAANSFVLRDCHFDSNRADVYSGFGGAFGGGLLATKGGTSTVNPVISSCTFTNNYADAGGGGAAVGGLCLATISGCTLVNNSAPGCGCANNGGGALRLTPNGGVHRITVENCELSSNHAGVGGGLYGYEFTIVNSTLTQNTAVSGGGLLTGVGTAHQPNNVIVDNCVVWGNVATNGADIYVGSPNPTTIRYSDVGNILGNWRGSRNFNADPQFTNPTAGMFQLTAGSPCIDRGRDSFVPAGLTVDINGLPRIVDDPATASPAGSLVDMGAHEFQGPDQARPIASGR